MSNINSYVNSASTSATGSPWASIMQMVILGVGFIGLMMWSRRKAKKEEQSKIDLLNNLQVGDTVQTTGGIIGIISFISSDKQIVEIRTGTSFSNPISLSFNAILSNFNVSKDQEKKANENIRAKEMPVTSPIKNHNDKESENIPENN